MEHTIDEQSPLCGHTFDTLMQVRTPCRAPSRELHLQRANACWPALTPDSMLACMADVSKHVLRLLLVAPAPAGMCQARPRRLARKACLPDPAWLQGGAEVIVTFEGTTEMGNPFMVRQSYLPMEIHWGHSFVSIISKPEPGDTHYYVDMTRSAHTPLTSDLAVQTLHMERAQCWGWPCALQGVLSSEAACQLRHTCSQGIGLCLSVRACSWPGCGCLSTHAHVPCWLAPSRSRARPW